MTVYEGTIITQNREKPAAKYLVAKGKKIDFVGDSLPKQYSDADIIKLGKKVLLPSFVDSHIHFASFALFNSGLNVNDARSNIEMLEMIKEFASDSKSKILIMFGASPHCVKEKTLLTRKELDTVTYDKPGAVIKYDGHALIANTALINLISDETKKMRGYNEISGEMGQEAFFAIIDMISASIPTLDLIRYMQEAVDVVAEKGIGMVHTVSGVGFPNDLDVTLESLFAKGVMCGFQSRVFFQTMDVKKVKKRKLPRIGGCFLTALDGCYGSKDAAMNKPYVSTKDKGVLFYDDNTVIDFCIEANRAGLQIELHAIGDAAFDQAVLALSVALNDSPRDNHRHCIIHACLPSKKSLALCKKHNILFTMQSAFLDWPQEPASYLKTIIGDRADKLNPIRTISDLGLTISFSSDGPCTTPDPLKWIHNAVNNPIKSEQISAEQALKMCTYNGYYTTFDEDQRGTLEQGKIADIVILSDNPLTINKKAIKDIEVEELILKGRTYKRQPKSILSLLWGMIKNHNRS
jgi:predicted amidohydrolase YtcJ